MKRIPISFAIGLLILGCSDKDNSLIQEDNLLGTWELIEQREYGGTPNTDWRPTAYSYQIELKADGKFVSSRFSECAKGEYFVSSTDNTLTFEYSCPDFSVKGLSGNGIFLEKYSFDGKYLILSPTYLTCDEGCAFKFERK